MKQLVQDLADEIAELGAALAIKEKRRNISTLPCHGSVRAATAQRRRNERLVARNGRYPTAGQCNHGRPTYVELKLADIEKLFGRR